LGGKLLLHSKRGSFKKGRQHREPETGLGEESVTKAQGKEKTSKTVHHISQGQKRVGWYKKKQGKRFRTPSCL